MMAGGWLSPLLWGLGSFILTVPAVWLALSWLRRRQFLDHPNERSSHLLPTPRGGGLALSPIMILGWLLLILVHGAPLSSWPVPAAAVLLFALSWWDDLGHVGAGRRLLVHLLAAALGLAALPASALLFQGLLPFWADRAVALFLLVWMTNLTNFMDGIDGITGIESAAIGLGLLLVAGNGFAAPEAIIVGASLAFLVWNWHPARLFLGDSGSVPLGFLLGWLLLSAAGTGHPAAALILPAYYLTDAGITLLKRLVRGEKIWQAHRQHFYQQAVRRGASHAKVALLILEADIGLIVLALLSERHPWLALAAALAVIVALLHFMNRLGRCRTG